MVEKNSYIIGKQRTEEGHKLFLGKVTAIDGNILSGYIEKNCHLPKLRQLFELPLRDVAVNLGTKPYAGSVHKFDTSHLYTGHKKEHDFFGPLHFFYVGGRYDDELVRTAEGWKIAKRVETTLWFEGTLPTELLRTV